MKITVTETMFKDAFLFSDERKNQFSYEALTMMFEYLETDVYEGYEFDMIGCCCTWQETVLEDIVAQYNIDLSGCLDYTDKKQVIEDYLQNNTDLIGFVESTNSFLFAEF